ncbi:MAG TPA: YtxH domain-containing protein [Chitinophagaceae bacterium]|nr:YtxH domain-containing protein [Chitinophagaceae bacterium]
MKAGNMLLGVLAGAAIGAVLGILYAPDKGSATRNKITKKGRKLAGDLQDQYDEFVSTMKDKFKTVKDEVLATAENGSAGNDDFTTR